MRQYLILMAFALVVASALSLAPVVKADVASNQTTVNVSVLGYSAITITPTNLTWPILVPGNTNATYNIEIKNTGSTALDSFYATPSTFKDEATSPLGGASASAYASAGFVFIRNASNTTTVSADVAPKAFQLGRIEWNLSDILSGETLDLGTGITDNYGAADFPPLFAHGWYRNATGNDFLWKVENGTDGYCNTTTTTFVIKNAAETTSQQNRDLSSGTTAGTAEQANANWTVFSISAGQLSGYCAAVSASCNKVYLYKYDMAGPDGTPFPTTPCSNSAYLRTGALNPGQSFAISAFAAMPKGVPAGQTQISRITITAGVAA